jgi:protein-S-isoprenylcysteine O-methyltransferase Ste14
MSLGVVVMMGGIALCRRSTLALGLAVVLFLIVHLVVVLLEEPGLEKRFGDSYREYCWNVHRWWPRMPRRSDASDRTRD